MHYLEDDLELLEGVPEELKQQCFEMRELDGRVEKSLADVREESREFFNIINQLNPEERERRCAKIRETYKSIREMSEEKLAIAEYLHLMLEKYQERIAKDLTEFKYELEADTAGVTDGIEKELGESIKTASASRRTVRPVLGNQLATVAEHDSTLEDVKPPGDLSSTQSSSTNMYRMNGHRHPSSSSEAHSQSDERRLGDEFVASSQQNQSTSAARQLAVRRPVTGGTSRTSLDEASSRPDFLPPKRKVPRPSGASPMTFNQPQQQVLDSFGIRKTCHPSQRYSPAPISVLPAGSASVNASRQPVRFNYPNISTLPGPVIGSRSGGGGHGVNRPLVGQPSNETAQKIGPSSSSSSESTYQQHHSVQPGQPTFAGQAESQSSYGRPVKLTSRVQQMLKDRQIQGHRGHVGRPTGSVYSASSSSSSSYNNSSNYGQSARFSSGQHVNNVGELSEEEGRQVYSQDQQYLDEEADEEDVEALGEEDEEADEDSEDQDSRVWCTCQQKSEGDMVACDNKSCPYEWFHYSCVGITAPPKGKWFCPTCVKKMRRSQSTENH